MTRLVGLVHDAEAGDIILVGKAVEDRPQANLDDLVVALRARLVRATWPLVSIDPTAETPRTGRQVVRFDGGIEDTRFGQQFLDCDIMLKEYSLGFLDPVTGVESYKALCERSIRNRFGEKGVTVRSAQWLPFQTANQPIRRFYGRPIQTQEIFQTRFWFRPLPSAITERDGVFVIRDLCLGVAKEVILSSESDPHSDSPQVVGDAAADDFSGCFTEHFPEIASRYPNLKRLEMLYAMVAAAEGIAHLEEPPDLRYFLYKYEVPHVATDADHGLFQLCGVLTCSDSSDYLIKVSGGIELRTLLTQLNDGDVDAMRDIVLNSRPSSRSLYWVVPLSGWRIPNRQYCQEPLETGKNSAGLSAGLGKKKLGFSLHLESFELAPAGAEDIGPANLFVGFSPLAAVPSPVASAIPLIISDRLGGVDMPIEPKSEKADLQKLKDSILQSKPQEDSLSWPVEIPDKE